MQLFSCKICGGSRYVLKSGQRVACQCVLISKLRTLLPFIADIDFKKVDVKGIYTQIQPILKPSLEDDFQILCDFKEPELYTMIALLLIHYKVSDYRIMNVYELIDIYLGKHPTFNSFFSINNKVLCMLMGWNEFENRRQEDAILQFLDICRVKFHRVFFFIRTSGVDLPAWNRLLKYVDEKGYHKLQLKQIKPMSKMYRE